MVCVEGRVWGGGGGGGQGRGEAAVPSVVHVDGSSILTALLWLLQTIGNIVAGV